MRDGEPMGEVRSAAPALGGHTRAVLEEYGVPAGQIDKILT
jgi:crotonobetainyl-CoA:carnitine CoA-transferase CaiB-like acyl-CoA transferase